MQVSGSKSIFIDPCNYIYLQIEWGAYQTTSVTILQKVLIL